MANPLLKSNGNIFRLIDNDFIIYNYYFHLLKRLINMIFLSALSMDNCIYCRLLQLTVKDILTALGALAPLKAVSIIFYLIFVF
jgi:hypothetical protein